MAMRFARPLAAAALTLAVAGAFATAPAPALAQNASGQSETQQFSDAKLQAYAAAAVEVSQLMQEWRPKMQKARKDGDKEKMKSIQQDANADLVRSIKDAEGITLDEYKNITSAARQDKALYKKLNRMVNNLRQQQG